MLKNLFFLLCPERCGSNLILRMVDSHPQCMGPGATHLFRIMLHNLSRYGKLEQDANWRRLVEHTVAVFRTNKIWWKRQVDAEDLLQRVQTRSLAALLRQIYEDEAEAEGKSYAFVKENRPHEILPLTQGAFPEGKYVYMTRDPRDMALSFKNISWYLPSTPTARRGAALWQADNAQFLKIYLALRDTGNIHFTRYEDLLDDPEGTLEKLCEFFGLHYADSMLRFHESERCQGEKNLRACYKNLSRPLIRGNKSKFRKQLSEAEIRWIEHHCAAEMRMLGYDPVFGPSENPEALNRELDAQEEHDARNWLDPTVEETAEDLQQRIELLQSISAQEELPIV